MQTPSWRIWNLVWKISKSVTGYSVLHSVPNPLLTLPGLTVSLETKGITGIVYSASKQRLHRERLCKSRRETFSKPEVGAILYYVLFLYPRHFGVHTFLCVI